MKRLSHLLVASCILASPALLAFPPHPAQPPRPAASASGEGDSYWDFRVGAGSEPMLTDAEYDFNDGTPVDEYDWEAPGGSLEFNASHRFAGRSPASAFMAFGGFLRGFGGNDDPDTGDEVALSAVGVQVGGGFSYRPNARYSLEIGPRIGVGVAGATERVGGDDVESDGGGYARLDVGVANLFNFRKVQLGVTVGLASWAATVPYDSQTVNGNFYPAADVTYSGAGGYLNFSIGFR